MQAQENSSDMGRAEPFYGLFSPSYMGWIALALAGSVLHPAGMAVVTAALLAWALTSPRRGIQALSVLVVIKYLNPALATPYPYSGVVFWFFAYVTCLACLLRVRPSHFKHVLPLAYFYLVMLVLSFWSSRPLVSILKATSFCGIVGCLLLGYAQMQEEDLKALLQWFFSLALTVFLLSLLTLPFPGIAFHRNGRGFQGILNHPQAFGIFWPPFILWMAFDRFHPEHPRQTPAHLLFLLGMIAAVFASRARTAMGAVLFGACLTILWMLASSKVRSVVPPTKTLVLTAAVVLALSVLVAAVPPVRSKVVDFFVKGEEKKTVSEALYESRGQAALQQWRNFLKKPLTGNGFGVYPGGTFPGRVTYFLGIPISASVEKGVVPTAVLEEIGLIGAAGLAVFLAALLLPVVGSTNANTMAMLAGCFGVNLGEAIFFSMGGNGLFYWLLMGWCWTTARKSNLTP